MIRGSSMLYVEKNVGETMKELRERVIKENNLENCKIASPGTLDPMAKGVVLFLIGNECKKINDGHST